MALRLAARRRVHPPAQLAAAALVGIALVTAACATEPDVVVVEAAPIGPGELAAPPATLPSPDATAPPTASQPPDATTATPTEPPPPTEPTLPPIAEPQLFAEVPVADVLVVDDERRARDYDPFLGTAMADIERWWGETYPAVYGKPFEPLEGGVHAGYPGRQLEIPGCGEPRTRYPDLVLYVAFYCEFGDFIAFDEGDTRDSILVPLAETYGEAVLGVVLAHEFGHAIQLRSGALEQGLDTITTEQQADCFAGAWVGQAYRGESPLLRLGDADVRTGLLAMLEVRDPVGTNQFEPGGHGSAFDRVGAFQEGFIQGPIRCGELLDDPLPLMPNEFRSQADFANQGNADYDCGGLPPDSCTPAPEFLADDLNDFWTDALGSTFTPLEYQAVLNPDQVECADPTLLNNDLLVCPSTATVVFDEPDLLELYADFGDFTLGYFYGIAWAERAQQVAGSALAGEQRALLNDCYTGAWVTDITPDDQGRTRRGQDTDGDGFQDTGISSSPGDLDEAIRMAILYGDAGVNVDVVGSPFEKIESFRAGVLGGRRACDARLA